METRRIEWVIDILFEAGITADDFAVLHRNVAALFPLEDLLALLKAGIDFQALGEDLLSLDDAGKAALEKHIQEKLSGIPQSEVQTAVQKVSAYLLDLVSYVDEGWKMVEEGVAMVKGLAPERSPGPSNRK